MKEEENEKRKEKKVMEKYKKQNKEFIYMLEIWKKMRR
jgi:hypothetical protein